MEIQEAIKKAIEGGYEECLKNGVPKNYINGVTVYEINFLDPQFWQSLGKAMGWNEYKIENRMCPCGCDGNVCASSLCGDKCPYDKEKARNNYDEWKYQWHKFVDHLASGETIETFFETL